MIKGICKKERAKKIFYISSYLPNEEKYKMHCSPAAQSKVNYIRTKLVDYDSITVCVNCSLTVDNSVFMPRKIKDKYGKCEVLFSISSTKRCVLPLSGFVMLLSLFLYVLFNVKKNDTIILYHSVYYDSIVIFLKKIKKYRIVYEIEEIYADVRNNGRGREKEIKKCESSADAFIFPTEMLDKLINANNKKSVIIYGAYKPEERKLFHTNSNGKKTLIVYSGTLMKGKGAAQAIEVAKSLDSNYEIRIIGYGSREEIETIQQMIEENNSECKVVFDGMKYGSEYIDYLCNCDIGLCIQPSDAGFNATSFPSKILSYLNCGLKVVATEMETLKISKLADVITFTKNSDPIEIGNAIKVALQKDVDNKAVLEQLDQAAKRELCYVLTN